MPSLGLHPIPLPLPVQDAARAWSAPPGGGTTAFVPSVPTMPRYFFHRRVGERMIWDGVGIELPDLGLASDPDRAANVWADIIAGRQEPGFVLVVTDERGKVMFVKAE